MRFVKFCCVAALFVPFALSAVGCGSDEASQMATDEELSDYGQSAAPEALKNAYDQGSGSQE